MIKTKRQSNQNLKPLPEGNQSNKITYRELIMNKLEFDQEGKCTNAFKIICNEEILKIAYNIIKSGPGNMTKGVDRETLDGISSTWFDKTAKEL
jgi:hypothetical protein